MGRELLETYPDFAGSIYHAGELLEPLHPGGLDLYAELTRDEGDGEIDQVRELLNAKRFKWAGRDEGGTIPIIPAIQKGLPEEYMNAIEKLEPAKGVSRI
jgi:hypothetical protein